MTPCTAAAENTVFSKTGTAHQSNVSSIARTGAAVGPSPRGYCSVAIVCTLSSRAASSSSSCAAINRR